MVHPTGLDTKTEIWNDSLSGDFLWSNTNFGEAVSETMTPMTWSVIQFTLDDWTFLSGYPTVGNIGGRPYVNISIFATLFQLLRRNRRQLLKALEGTMYMQLPEELEIPLIPLNHRQILASIVAASRTRWKQILGWRCLPKYLAENPAWFANMRSRIQAEKSPKNLLDLWTMEIQPHIKNGVWTVLGTVDQATAFSGKIITELSGIVGADDTHALISKLSTKSEQLPSLGVSIGVAQLANDEISRQQFIDLYGHRGPNEFEISAPRPAEDPDWLDRQVNEYRRKPIDIKALLNRQQSAFDSAWHRFSSRFPQKTRRMMLRINEYTRRARLREEARSEYVRDRWIIRIFAQQVGKLTGLEDEIFFLTLKEMLGLLSGSKISSNVILQRQDVYKQYKSLPSYPPLIRGDFDPQRWAADPKRRGDIFDPSLSEAFVTSQISGAAGSSGVAEGKVRILLDPDQLDGFLVGEILVARMTDISWTPIFPRAAAIVTDIGAPLSHAAIIARELGIPAVVGCQDATARLKTGDRIRVDGTSGKVTILEKQEG